MPDQVSKGPEKDIIFALEDDSQRRYVLKRLCQRSLAADSYKLLMPESLEEALDIVQEVNQAVRVVLIDVNLPHWSEPLSAPYVEEILAAFPNAEPALLTTQSEESLAHIHAYHGLAVLSKDRKDTAKLVQFILNALGK